MEKKMDTTIVYWGYIGDNGKRKWKLLYYRVLQRCKHRSWSQASHSAVSLRVHLTQLTGLTADVLRRSGQAHRRLPLQAGYCLRFPSCKVALDKQLLQHITVIVVIVIVVVIVTTIVAMVVIAIARIF